MKRPEGDGVLRQTLRISRKLADLCLSGLAELKGEPSPMKTTWYCPLDLVRLDLFLPTEKLPANKSVSAEA